MGTRQAVRSYTPVSDPGTVGFFDLLIKTYPSGCISKHISELKVGDQLEVKGPKGSFEYGRNAYEHLGMIAGGTGITPMYQVIRHILEDPADRTRISLIYANVNEDDILLRKELDGLAKAHPSRFRVFYTLDNPPKNWPQGKGFVTADMINSQFSWSPSSKCKVLLCGPPPMVSSMSGHCEKLGFGPASTQPFDETTKVYKF